MFRGPCFLHPGKLFFRKHGALQWYIIIIIIIIMFVEHYLDTPNWELLFCVLQRLSIQKPAHILRELEMPLSWCILKTAVKTWGTTSSSRPIINGRNSLQEIFINIYLKVYLLFFYPHCSSYSRPPLGLDKIGVVDHFWIVQRVIAIWELYSRLLGIIIHTRTVGTCTQR